MQQNIGMYGIVKAVKTGKGKYKLRWQLNLRTLTGARGAA